jgi:hypothetical protein
LPRRRVAVAVQSAALLGVIALAVELDDQVVLVVAPVAASPAAVRFDERRLLACRGQPVGALDVTVVAVLEDGVRARRRLRHDLIEISAPPELPTDGDCLS